MNNIFKIAVFSVVLAMAACSTDEVANEPQEINGGTSWDPSDLPSLPDQAVDEEAESDSDTLDEVQDQ
jgi:outer membrane protein assembly factor BamE (lipoprotein component of BamABCDE complex)